MSGQLSQPERQSTEAERKAQTGSHSKRYRLGVVTYLPARALVYGLEASPGIELVRVAPARLKRLLAGGELDVALLPATDLPCFGERLTVLSAGCLAGSGPTLLAKIFSQVKPEDMSVLWADSGSRSSVALAQVVWSSLYHKRLSIVPFDPVGGSPPPDAEAVLLVGDKVVAEPPIRFERHYDPVAMWYEMTGLPFVGVVWATTRDKHCKELYEMLLSARQQGQRNLIQIATECGPAYGWPADLAVRCMTRDMQFEFTDAHREGMEEFLELAAELKLIEFPRPLRYYPPVK